MSIAYCTPHTTLLDSLYKLLTVQTTHCANYSLCRLLYSLADYSTHCTDYSLYSSKTASLSIFSRPRNAGSLSSWLWMRRH